MSQEIRMTALGALTIALMSAAWAAGSKTAADTSSATGAGQNASGTTASAQVGQGANGNGTGNGSGQSGAVANTGSNGKDQALQRKQARAARHADIDKARQRALDSLQTAFAGRETAEVGGSSEIVNEKVHEKAAK